MHLVFAAAAAVAAALVEFTVVPYLKIGGAAPHPVLVFGVIWAIAGGLEAGLTWAFVGGLALDILGQRPLGSSAFSLLIAVGAASIIASVITRVRIAAPVIATLACSPLYSMLVYAATTALTTPSVIGDPTSWIVPSTVYDTVLALITGPLVMATVLRRRDTERADW